MDEVIRFREVFKTLTGVLPFPWQEDLYIKHFSRGTESLPSSCALPTGLGKTSVVAIWLIALARHPGKLPRRLVYVVNRRTVVDQTTLEVEKLRERLREKELREKLGGDWSFHGDPPLAISTLRGQFADNREWSADPSRPAVICGTVDMIGSRLLFSGYAVGFKAKPLHAGFLGQDALIVHDEAHLEPAFQKLLKTVQDEQRQCKDFAPFHVMELTATGRGNNGEPESTHAPKPTAPFELTSAEKTPPQLVPEPQDDEPPIHTVWRRLKATKRLHLKQAADDAEIPEEIADIALRLRKDESGNDANAAIAVFVRTPDEVLTVCGRLANKKDGVLQNNVQQLTGTMRGLERDQLTKQDPVFMRFLPQKSRNPHVAPATGTVFLVCTSAGEVGVDISADHMVSDLSTFESMAQRFGRVNRYGLRADTCITVVYPAAFDAKDKLTPARQATLKLLQKSNGDASPKSLSDFRERSDLPCKVEDAFAPEPVIPTATDILFDAWALTSIREPMPGRPPVEPYLHGIAEWQPPETHVAWRTEVEIITGDLLDPYPPVELLDDYPLLPHELLRDRSDRVFKQLETLAKRHPDKPAWMINDRGTVQPTTLRNLADKQQKDQIEGKTILLPPSAGGLSMRGMLDGNSDQADDVADTAVDERNRSRRRRIWDDEPCPPHLRIIRTIDTRPDADETDSGQVEAPRRFWHWCDAPREGGRTANRAVTWEDHVAGVVDHAKRIVAGLSLPKEITEGIIVAAKLHDYGKKRELFQFTIGNRQYPRVTLAKSANRTAARLPESFRHEFASVLDAKSDPDFGKLSPAMQELVQHLIAAHHGRARPHFDPDEAFDPERSLSEVETLNLETPRRFARLQRRFGRWGLAYLESILRAADWAASAAEAEASS